MTEPKTTFHSQRGLELSSVEWLLDHHQAKEAQRRQMVEDLGLRPGDRVLDSACGPGLWARMFAGKVMPGGGVVGLDFSPDLITYAEASLRGDPVAPVIAWALGDFHHLPLRDKAFDAVFLGNCFCYVEDIASVLEQHKRVTKPGGRVISKEFDGGPVVFHPIDPGLTLQVVTAAARALAEDHGTSRFDNFVGRKMNGVFREAGFTNVATRSYAIQKVPPLSPADKRYIASNARWYGDRASPYLSNEERVGWQCAFDPASDSYVLDRPDFYFVMIETVTVGQVGE